MNKWFIVQEAIEVFNKLYIPDHRIRQIDPAEVISPKRRNLL